MPEPVVIPLDDETLDQVQADAGALVERTQEQIDEGLTLVELTQQEIDHVYTRRMEQLSSSAAVVSDNTIDRDEALEFAAAMHLVQSLRPHVSPTVVVDLEMEYQTLLVDLEA